MCVCVTVPGHLHCPRLALHVSAGEREVLGQRSIHTEHHGLGVRRQDEHVAPGRGVVSSERERETERERERERKGEREK